jgi:hypothetical protein
MLMTATLRLGICGVLTGIIQKLAACGGTQSHPRSRCYYIQDYIPHHLTANGCPIARTSDHDLFISKWIADALGPDGIYASWIALRRYPWLTPFEFQNNGEIASDVMTSADKLVVLHEGYSCSARAQSVQLSCWQARLIGLTHEQSACWTPGSITASPSCEMGYCWAMCRARSSRVSSACT